MEFFDRAWLKLSKKNFRRRATLFVCTHQVTSVPSNVSTLICYRSPVEMGYCCLSFCPVLKRHKSKSFWSRNAIPIPYESPASVVYDLLSFSIRPKFLSEMTSEKPLATPSRGNFVENGQVKYRIFFKTNLCAGAQGILCTPASSFFLPI